MNTPRKNYDDLQSPYAKHLAQYPSQSEEFLPFDLGGPGTGNHGNRQTPQKNMRYTSTPAKFDPYRGGGGRGGDSAQKFTPGGNYSQNRHHQQQHHQHKGRGNNNRFYGISGAGRQSFNATGGDHATVDGDKSYQRQPQRYNTQRGGRGGGGGGGQQRFHNSNKDNNGSGSYFHPSMLEDPWRELMQRHNAIRNSQIDIQTTQKEEQQQDAPEQQDKNDSSAESAASEAEQNNEEL